MEQVNEDYSAVPATSEDSKSIKSISKDNVHKICSGQVIVSLSIAVKELVENSIDAGATSVEVKLIDYGKESIEVSDNGHGVEDHNLEGMTAKYHTSKLREFTDLQSVVTFGFRGEALSSLCALANMTIITRHKNTDVGTKIEMDHEGNIISRTRCARSIGTTVILANIFEKLPVRRRAFVKNVKKEFTQMCQILQAYGLVCKGVRIKCTNQTNKGNKVVVIQTQGSDNVSSNISAVFGSRQANDVLEMKSPLRGSDNKNRDVDELLEELQQDLGDSIRLTREDVKRMLRSEFEGYISSCAHGSGRSSKDRQFFYVNSRPCDPKNISKVVNEYYHRYNPHQFPFVYLNIVTDRESVDVNLTPDKRQLHINNEKILMALIKKALGITFSSIPSTYKMQNTTIAGMITMEQNSPKMKSAEEQVPLDDEKDDIYPTSTQTFSQVLSQWKRTGDTGGTVISSTKTSKRKCHETEEIRTRTLKMIKIQAFLKKEQPEKGLSLQPYKSESEDDENEQANDGIFDQNDKLTTSSNADETQVMYTKSTEIISEHAPESLDDSFGKFLENSSDIETHIALDDSDVENYIPRITCNEMKISISEIESILQKEHEFEQKMQQKSKMERLRFKSEINPIQNKTAEAELQKEISKSHFASMEILGQFNLGFIITKLDADLFIVDQHATDEKYNFETLQKTTQLHHQPLAIAQPLELTAVNEMVLIDHLPIFEKNGFKFEIKHDAPPTKKISLLGKPMSKNWEFGKEDIDELIFMLQDAPEGTMCRPSRIRAMFASRACRKSVMIGTSLKKSTMEMLVKHMGEIEQPWNCPHGRPTMRHLINYALLKDSDVCNDDPKATCSN
ncbi:mismatch repair endonuclease PMS2 [Musca vetustissima]|uniref:mismatch repair endonuclease PMS2 n=1 Tax=Musca vetustissima TaxID=27455 RepID=UPI002AB76DA1|nr:mismatch repair endonuclease PMS2 [Musca vetustissima]